MWIETHAVEQFQARISQLPEKVVREIIENGVKTTDKVKLLPEGGTLRIRTRRPFPFEFRALLVYDEELEAPVVTTVLKGESWKLRKQRNRDYKK